MHLEELAGAVLPQAGEQVVFVPPGYSKECVRRVGRRRGARTSLVTLSTGDQRQCRDQGGNAEKAEEEHMGMSQPHCSIDRICLQRSTSLVPFTTAFLAGRTCDAP